MYVDEKLKMAKEYERKAWERQQQAGQPMAESAGPLLGSDSAFIGAAPRNRTPIRYRIEQALQGANSVLRRAEAAQRAKNIIDQHPELAELLDALNEF